MVEVRQLRKLQKAGMLLPRDILQLNLDRMLRMNISGCCRDVVTGRAVLETLRKHLSTDRAYKFADAKWQRQVRRVTSFEDGAIGMTFEKSGWIRGYVAFTLQAYCSKEKKEILKEETLGERGGQRIVPSNFLGRRRG